MKRGFGTVGVDFPYHLPPAEGLRPSFASEDTITWRKSGSNAELVLFLVRTFRLARHAAPFTCGICTGEALQNFIDLAIYMWTHFILEAFGFTSLHAQNMRTHKHTLPDLLLYSDRQVPCLPINCETQTAHAMQASPSIR